MRSGDIHSSRLTNRYCKEL